MGIVIEHLFLSFIRFRTVPMAADGGRFGTAAPASHMVSQSGKNTEGSSRKTRGLPVSAGRRWSDVTPWQMGMGRPSLKRLERNRREPKNLQADERR